MHGSSPHKFILSGGGTGGHIFPAIAIADAIRRREPGADILFVGALGRMEMEKVPAAGYRIEGLPVSGLQRRLTLQNLVFPFRVIVSLLKAGKILRSFRPDVVIGTGGYASGPTLKAASSLGIPTLIQEQNSFPGITNRMLSGKADRICVAYDGMEKFFRPDKIILTGNPVRKDILDLHGKRREAAAFFGLPEGKKILLVIGGSLGARTINESIQASLERLAAENIGILWQTGKAFYPEAEARLPERLRGEVRIMPFIQRMDLAYAQAEVIVSRAGAIAISELCIAGKAAILVPSPNVAEDHQTRNARALVEKSAAVLVSDAEARERLASEVLSLMEDGQRRDSLSAAISSLARPEATEQITDTVFSLLQSRKS